MNFNLIELAAQIYHEANRALNAQRGSHRRPWEDAEEWERDSSRAVVTVIMGAGSNYDPVAHHERWMQERLAAGWRLGPVRDPDKREHPNLMPYEQLPESAKALDILGPRVVRAVLGVLA